MNRVLTEKGKAVKYPYSIREMRADNPQVSFPDQQPDSLLAEYGIYTVTEAARPDFNKLTHRLQRAALPELIDGAWVIGWEVVKRDKDDAAERQRAERDRLLRATDWTQGKDATRRITEQQVEEFAQYRQDLCDVTKGENWPFGQLPEPPKGFTL